ncbi:hypothetical protein C4X49_00300 [Acinetobacter baumannii]|uniref:glycosyltransferase family 2 protein n=1 Tax=Acinetobacter baumannii TaxID=470 RepID=UPI00101F66D2|nr:glycosyltransferase family A protein [Acinetobacter baumannii]QBC46037.1 hypothetical protein C4X49_00300 [Acinetobacter baumannii]
MKFSIIVPFFNNDENIDTLKITLSDYIGDKDVEVIIVDDFSCVDSYLNLKSAFSNFSNVHIYRNEKNMGPALTRNKGVEFAQGEYIFFLDADDGWIKNKAYIEYEYNILNGVAFSGSKALMIDRESFYSERNNKLIIEENNIKTVEFSDALFSNPFSTPSVCIKRNLIEQNLFNPDIRYSEDIDCWRRALNDSVGIQFNTKSTFIFKHPYLSSNGLSTNTWKMTKGALGSLFGLLINSKINIKFKFLIPFAIFYEFIKGLYREYRFFCFKLGKKHEKA